GARPARLGGDVRLPVAVRPCPRGVRRRLPRHPRAARAGDRRALPHPPHHAPGRALEAPAGADVRAAAAARSGRALETPPPPGGEPPAGDADPSVELVTCTCRWPRSRPGAPPWAAWSSPAGRR